MPRIDQTAGIYSIGIATACITPPIGTPLGGYSARAMHSSTGVYHPLKAVALAIDDGETPMLLVSVEWIGFYDLAERVRQRLSEAVGIPREQIVLTATHTHCGPAVRQKDVELFGWIDNDYIHRSLETLATIAQRAWRFRVPSTLRFGTAIGALAMNRRLPDPQKPGRVERAILPNPEGVTDQEVSFLVVESEGLIRGILFSYACHPTSRDGLLIGGDYPAFACDYLQEAFREAQTMFLLGCAGDQRPRPVDPGNSRFGSRTIAQVEEAGFELGRTIEQAILDQTLGTITGPISVGQKNIFLQTEALDRQAVAEALADPNTPGYAKRWAEYHQARMESGLPEERDVPFEVQTVRFGQSLAFIAFAAEMVVEYGLRLKADLCGRFAHVLPIAYANGIIGYVSNRRQFDEYGYEVLDANLHQRRTGRYLPETEDRILTAVNDLLAE